MAKVWLDVGGLLDPAGAVAAAQVDCARIALASEPGHFAFCAAEAGRGFRDVEAQAVQAALESLGQRVPVAARPPQGWRRHAKQLIGRLPEPMQAPAMAFGRAGVRLFQDGGQAPSGAAGVVPGDLRAPFGASDVLVSFGEADEAVRALRARLRFQVLQVGGTAPSDASPMERWANAQVSGTRQADGALVARTALVAASQGRTGFEDRLQHLYMSLLEDGDFCIDIGAHTGRHALPMSCAVGSGSVAAFEPNPPIAQRLRARLELLAVPNVKVHELALSDESGTAEFVVAVDRPEESGLKERVYNGPTRQEKVAVRLAQLDSLALGDPRFIKLDTEGAEYKVMLGMRNTVVRSRPVIAFEFGEQSYSAYGVDPNDVFAYFGSLGYDVFSIHGERLEQAAFAKASHVQSYWDYVACDRAQSSSVSAILKSFG
ncbi:MAG: FkbM family methyltransferase [Ramlibacter sp.]|nr:FkbM family methyltransferase [Ramlibacter sp.]